MIMRLPRRLRDGPRVVLGAAGIVAWVAAAVFAVQSVPEAIRTTWAWLRRAGTTKAGDVAVAWLLIPASILLLVAVMVVPAWRAAGVAAS
jgi:hypothetical protein